MAVGRARDARARATAAGTADGSIIAAIIAAHTPRNQPSPPRSVPGPASIPRIRSRVTAHAAAAAVKNTSVVLAGQASGLTRDFLRPRTRPCERRESRTRVPTSTSLVEPNPSVLSFDRNRVANSSLACSLDLGVL